MKMRTTSAISLAIFTVTILMSPYLRASTLMETVREAIATNPEVLIAGSERDSVEQQMEQARGGMFPQVDITLGTGLEATENRTTIASGNSNRKYNRDEAEIRVRQLLYDGNATESEFERQRARVNSHAYDTFSKAEEVGLKATEAYLNVLRERKLVQLAQENLSSHEKIHDRIVKRGMRGVGNKADIQQALGRLARARTNLLSEKNRLDDANAAFLSIIGHVPGNLQEPARRDHLVPVTFDDVMEIALDNHPRLKSADADIDAAQEQLHAARALFAPRIHLEIKGSENNNLDGVPGPNNDTEIMLRGRYNFTGGRDVARRRETVIELGQAKEVRENTRRQVIESIQLSWSAWKTSRDQLESLKIHEDASKQALEAYRKQFSIGQRTLLDLLDQENEAYQASINYINGQYDAEYSTYRILAGIGKFLWALQVNPPVPANTIQ